MYVLIDEGACVGCGSCEALCPDVFVMNDRGTAEAIAEATVPTWLMLKKP